MTAYRIILADDHPILRKGIRKILEETDGMCVVGEADNGMALLDLLRTIKVDMVILDLSSFAYPSYTW